MLSDRPTEDGQGKDNYMGDILNLSEARVPPPKGKFCVSCGTRMDGAYCSNCGSRAARPKWPWAVGALIAFFTLIGAITRSTNNQAVQAVIT